MKKIIFLFGVLVFIQAVLADQDQDSFVEAAYSGNIMLVKTHLNDLRGQGKERHNEALRAALSAQEPAAEAPAASSNTSKIKDKLTSKISAKFKGSTIEVVKMLLAGGANPNDQSFGRPTIFSTATNAELKTALETAGGKLSTSDQLAAAVKEQNPEEFAKILAQTQPNELKLGNGVHIPTVIFDSYALKTEGDLIPYTKNQTPLVKMYASLLTSKKASDLFVVYSKDQTNQFGRLEKTEPLVGRFLNEERWDLLEMLTDQNETIATPFDKQWAGKWFNFRKNLMLSLIQDESTSIKDPGFERMNQFLDGSRIKKFDDFAKKLPAIEAEQLDKFFLESEITSEDKLKLFEELNLKISAPTMVNYITKKESLLQEQEFRRLEKLTEKGKPIDPETVIKVFEAGNLKTSQQLLRLGANPDSNFKGETGLCIAIKKSNFQLAQLLKSYNATATGTCNGADGKPINIEKMEMNQQFHRLIFGN